MESTIVNKSNFESALDHTIEVIDQYYLDLCIVDGREYYTVSKDETLLKCFNHEDEARECISKYQLGVSKKHTSGNWTYQVWEPEYNPHFSIYSDVNGRVKLADVGFVSGLNLPDEAEANARLIATAPEMLEALHKIIKFSSKDPQLVRDIARNAIQKATGD